MTHCWLGRQEKGAISRGIEVASSNCKDKEAHSSLEALDRKEALQMFRFWSR